MLLFLLSRYMLDPVQESFFSQPTLSRRVRPPLSLLFSSLVEIDFF